jgi:hypothetical protein
MKPPTMRRMYFREAALYLIVAQIAVRLLPPSFVLRWASRPLKRIRRFSGFEIDWVAWAIQTAGSKRWVGVVCLPRALAAQTMLRRRGIASLLCLGVARGETGLTTHAWLEIGQDIFVGGAERDRFTKIRQFSSGAQGESALL